MMNQKLREIGQKLGVSEKDIRGMGKKGIARNILYWIIGIIIGIIVAILSFVVGFFVGKGTCPSVDSGGGYPFAAGVVIPGMLSGKKKSTKITVLLISAIAFLVALKADPVFGQGIMYNVYKRKR